MEHPCVCPAVAGEPTASSMVWDDSCAGTPAVLAMHRSVTSDDTCPATGGSVWRDEAAFEAQGGNGYHLVDHLVDQGGTRCGAIQLHRAGRRGFVPA
jgi:hypothetical protein